MFINYCWNVEDNSSEFSDRIYKSNEPWSKPYIEEIRNLGWSADFNPKYVEVAWSNACNFKCSYCSPTYSTSWLKELKEHGPLPTTDGFNDIVDGDVSAEVISTDFEGMVKEGEALAALNPQIVIKLPLIEDGIKACKYFSDKGIKTNVTLVFSVGQAILAAKAGATYVSPFIGRLDDISTDGLNLIEEIRMVYDNYGYGTEILAASVRHTMHVVNCAKIGADVMTGPLSSIKGLLKHPLTDIGLAKFLADHAKANS